MKLAKIVLAILLATAFFSACERTTVQPTGIIPTAPGPTDIITKANVPFILPTMTIAPPTATIELKYPTLKPTLAALETQAAGFPHDCPSYYIAGNLLVSPDGNWLAIGCEGLPNETELLVINRDGKQRREVPNSELLSLYPKFEPDSFRFWPFHWSKDSQLVYFTISPYTGPDSGGVPNLGAWRGPLYQLDIQTGQWSRIVYESMFSTYYSFSSTDRRLIYVTADQHPIILHILDMKTGNINDIKLEGYYGAGDVAWSPDGLSFAFVAGSTDSNYLNVNFATFTYNIPGRSLKTISPTSPVECDPQTWSDSESITLLCTEYKNAETIRARYTQVYDLNTYQSVTTTPTP
jgi:hypothetical protein